MNFYISTSSRIEKNIVKKIFFTTVGLLITLFLFNVFINPYGEAFIKIKRVNFQSITEMSYQSKLKLLTEKKYKFDSYVIGSSQVSRIYAKDLEKYSGFTWISFPIPASMASEQYYYMKFFDNNYKIRNILYGLDEDNFFGTYLFRGNTIVQNKRDYSILDYLTFDAIKKSINKIRYNQLLVLFSPKPEDKYKYFNGWRDVQISKRQLDEVLNSAKPKYIKNFSDREKYYLEKIQKDFGEKLTPFITYYHPYIMLMKKKENYELFISSVINVFGKVWHINPKYIVETLKPDYYKDGDHTNRKFGIRIIKSIYSNDDFYIQIDKDSYESIIDEIYNIACQQDFGTYTFSNAINCEL